MKKSVFITISSVALFIACACVLWGCGGGNLAKYSGQISELRENLFAAENADYRISAISGVREEPYEMNGVSAETQEFTVITVTPTAFAPDKTYRYRVQIGESTFEGDLLPHPFAKSLSADIPCTATENFSLTLSCGGEEEFTLERVNTGELISAEKALTIALDKLDRELRRLKVKNKLNAEVYVRLIENPIDGSGGYFWYVAFVGEEKDTVAILLRGDTGAVAALRI